MGIRRLLFGGMALGLGAAATAGALAAAGVAAYGVVRSRASRRFLGAVVVITGGSRGLGLELAREFARAGAKLVLAARDLQELREAESTLVNEGLMRPEDMYLVACDVSHRSEAERMIAEATAHFGRVNVLVNNAGIIHVGPVEDQRVESFEHAMQVNFLGALYATKAVLPQMLERHAGNIVNIASIGGKMAVPHMLPYSASKFALVGFSEGLHAELRGKGVRVTTVCPGLMRTGSAPQALLVGDRAKEYRWFALGATTPIVAATARHAARKVVRSAGMGCAEITITPQAWLAARNMGLMPNLTQWKLGKVNDWVLPAPTGEDEPMKMSELQTVKV